MEQTRSKELFDASQRLIPGGVNSPVRAFRAVGGEPIFMARGEGAYLVDVDGNRFLDCIGSWGPLIFGHAHPRILKAIADQLPLGTTFGAPTELEFLLAEMIVEAVPSIEKLRMVSSGTEATMSAIRVARGFTGRDKIVKFEGNYHGHADFLLAKAGSGVATLGLPECAGVPLAVTADTLTLPYNDIAAVRHLFAELGDQIACVILEPVVGNMGCVPPVPGFLEALREVTLENGSVLIFDEVMTGFRLAYGGAQERFGVTPDVTTLGKIVGGGLPLGAYGGKREIMDSVAPVGPVYQAGTLSGNPVAVSAGLAQLSMLKEQRETIYPFLDDLGDFVANLMRQCAKVSDVPVCVQNVGSMVTVFFTDQSEVRDYEDAKQCDGDKFRVFFRSLLESGIYWPPSPFEAAFLSAAMTKEEWMALTPSIQAAFDRVAEKS